MKVYEIIGDDDMIPTQWTCPQCKTINDDWQCIKCGHDAPNIANMIFGDDEDDNQLDEINLRQAALAGIAGVSLLNPVHKAHTPGLPHIASYQKPATLPTVVVTSTLDAKARKFVDQISKQYNTDPDFVAQVVELVKKYQKPGFPTARDLLAIIAVESHFDPDAVSGLQHDPAVGLMQVRPKIWDVDPEQLKDPETSIRIGSQILHNYYRKLHHNKQNAVQAYNVGIENFRQGQDSPNYLMKVAQHLRKIPRM